VEYPLALRRYWRFSSVKLLVLHFAMICILQLKPRKNSFLVGNQDWWHDTSLNFWCPSRKQAWDLCVPCIRNQSFLGSKEATASLKLIRLLSEPFPLVPFPASALRGNADQASMPWGCAATLTQWLKGKGSRLFLRPPASSRSSALPTFKLCYVNTPPSLAIDDLSLAHSSLGPLDRAVFLTVCGWGGPLYDEKAKLLFLKQSTWSPNVFSARWLDFRTHVHRQEGPNSSTPLTTTQLAPFRKRPSLPKRGQKMPAEKSRQSSVQSTNSCDLSAD